MSRAGAKRRLQKQQKRKKGAISATGDLPESALVGDNKDKKFASKTKLSSGNSGKGLSREGESLDLIGSRTSMDSLVALVVLFNELSERFPGDILLFIIYIYRYIDIT